jgi:two-component system response regulator NreC
MDIQAPRRKMAANSNVITVAIADDHELVRRGIHSLLEHLFCIIGEASDGLEAVRLAEREKPDIFILDLMMPNLGGLEAIRQIRKKSPRTKTIMLSMHSDTAFAAQAIANGAMGYILKQAGSSHVIDAIYAAFDGQFYFSEPLSKERVEAQLQIEMTSTSDPYSVLTGREREILQLVAEGNTSVQIGEILFISARTVEVHRANLMRKLNLRSKVDLVRYAVLHGLIS